GAHDGKPADRRDRHDVGIAAAEAVERHLGLGARRAEAREEEGVAAADHRDAELVIGGDRLVDAVEREPGHVIGLAAAVAVAAAHQAGAAGDALAQTRPAASPPRPPLPRGAPPPPRPPLPARAAFGRAALPGVAARAARRGRAARAARADAPRRG